jgi:hypothetical protein
MALMQAGGDADPARGAISMNTDTAVPSDDLVFFGATGDLADKKIVPARSSRSVRGRRCHRP